MRTSIGILFLTLLLATFASAQITPIHDIQYVPDPEVDDASPMVGELVTIQGLVTFEPMSMGGNRFYIADDTGPWNGIFVYANNAELELGWGWEVQLTGEVSEYFGLTQILLQPNSIQVLNDRPDPATFWNGVHDGLYPALQYNDVAAGGLSTPNTAEQWESCLVQLNEPMQVLTLPDNFGEWTVDDAADQVVRVDNPADDVYGYKHWVLPSQSYDRMQGVLNFSFDEYKLLPEIAWNLKVHVDIASGFYDQVPYFQQVRPMDMTLRYDLDDDPYLWDHSYASRVRYGLSQGGNDPYGEDVVIHALVTYPTELGFVGDGAKFIMTDYLVGDTHEPWTSVLSYNPDPFTLGELHLGDEVVYYGQVGEYSTGPSNMTELWFTDPFAVLAAAQPLPAPAPLTVPELRDPLTAEPWGNSSVILTDVIVSDPDPTPFELFAVDDDLGDDVGSIKIDDDSAAMNGYPDPPQGAPVQSITGWVYHHFGSLYTDPDNMDWVYSVCPLYPDDIVLGGSLEPEFGEVYTDYEITHPDNPVTFFAMVSDADNDLESVTLHWRTGLNGMYTDAAMALDGDFWQYTIPAQPLGSSTWYWITASDQDANETVYPEDAPNNLEGYWTVTQHAVPHTQFTLSADGSSPYDGHIVDYVTGVVVNSPASAVHYGGNDTGPAVFIQGNSPVQGWNGLLVHWTTPNTPPIGAKVRVYGRIDESGEEWPFKWEGNTRINQLLTFDYLSEDNPLSFYELPISTVNDDLETFESCLVRFDDLIVESVNTYDITIGDGSGQTILLDDDLVPPGLPYHDWFDNLQPGNAITFVRGVLTYSFGTWKLEPRGMEDVGPAGDLQVDIESIGGAIHISPGGGNFEVDIWVSSPMPQQIDAWTQITHLATGNSVITNLFQNVGLPGGVLETSLAQNVPAIAPPGDYLYTLYLGDSPWVVDAFDSIGFDKQGGATATVAGWDDPVLWPGEGRFELITADGETGSLPSEYVLLTPYPNPFNPTTTVTVTLPAAAQLDVTVVNVTGREVARLARGQHPAGEHRFVFDATQLSSGLYFVRAQVPGQLNAVEKVMLVR